MNLKIQKESHNYLYAFCPQHEDKVTANFVINKVKTNGKPIGYAYCFVCGYTVQFSKEEVDKMSKKPTYYREKVVKKLTSDLIFKKMMRYWENRMMPNYPGDLVYQGSAHDFLIGWTGKEYAVPGQNEDEAFTSIQYYSLNSKKWYEEGSVPGIFVPNHGTFYRPPLICEGVSDTAAALDLGYYAIGKPSALVGNDIIVKFLIKHNIDRIVIVPDTDEAGYKGCENLQKILLTKDIEFDIISVEPWKDLREFVEKEGKEKAKELLNAKQS